MIDRYAAAKKQHFYDGFLSKGHTTKDCNVKACGIAECIKKQNPMLHLENQMNEGDHVIKVKAATINQNNEVRSVLQLIPVSIQSRDVRLNTYASLDSGSTVLFVNHCVQERLRAQGTDVTLHLAISQGMKDLGIEKFPLKIKGLHSKVQSVCPHVSAIGQKNYDYVKLKQQFNHLSVLPHKSFSLMEVDIILGQDAYALHMTLRLFTK